MGAKNLRPKFHGVLTLVFLLLALAVGLVGISLRAALPAVVYGLIVAAGLPALVHLFCGKCACRGEGCLMVLPGRLSLRMPSRKSDSYTKADFAGILGILVVLAVFPLYWLWQTKALLALFALFGLAAHAEIMLVVCRACGNCRCPVNRWFQKKGRIPSSQN
jgi:hypothetical protein